MQDPNRPSHPKGWSGLFFLFILSCFLFFVPYSLFLAPCSLFLAPCFCLLLSYRYKLKELACWSSVLSVMPGCLSSRERSIFFYQHRCIGRDAFFATCEAKLLGGCGFYRDVFLIRVHNLSQTGLHSLNMRIDLWTFSADRCVDIAKAVALCVPATV